LKNKFVKKIWSQFVAGLLVILPVFLTFALIAFILRKLDSIIGPIFVQYLGVSVPGLGFISLILIIWLTGIITTNYIGRKFIQLYESVLGKIPLLNTIFNSIKQISDTIFSGKKKTFEKVVLVNSPFYGFQFLGFLCSTEPSRAIISGKTIEVMHVFIPSPPNPTMGYVIIVPKEHVLLLDITPEEAVKEIISLGVVHPDIYRTTGLEGVAVPKITLAESIMFKQTPKNVKRKKNTVRNRQ
jgi:uncharacterized membrane protein